MQHGDLIVVECEAALQMRVSEESDCGGGVEKAVQSRGGRENVFVFIAEGAVNHDEAILVERAGGELLEPFAIFRAELLPRPEGYRAGLQIKKKAGFKINDSDNKNIDFTEAVHDFVGIGTVTKYVAATE